MASFEDVYKEYEKPVYRFLLSLTGDEDEAEELLQETFYRALVNIDRFEGRSSLYTWLCCIGKNAWMRECKRKKRYCGDISELDVPDSDGDPLKKLIQKDEYDKVRRAVYKLREPYRETFILHTFGGLKLCEIAERFGKSESWARVTYYRARQEIAKELEI